MKRAAQGAAWRAAITHSTAMSPPCGQRGAAHTPSHRGTDSAADPPTPPLVGEGADTHIIWNGEFMRGGLSRSIQTCLKDRDKAGEGQGGRWGGMGTTGSQHSLLASQPPRRQLRQEGKGRASGEVTRAPAPFSSSPLTCCPPTPYFSPHCHHKLSFAVGASELHVSSFLYFNTQGSGITTPPHSVCRDGEGPCACSRNPGVNHGEQQSL